MIKYSTCISRTLLSAASLLKNTKQSSAYAGKQKNKDITNY